MDPDVYRDLRETLDRLASEVAELRAGQELLASVLVARGELEESHAKILQRVREAVRVATRPRVYLGVLRDKHAVDSPALDCRALLPLCQARCCTFNVELTTQDLDEGGLKWELHHPYLLRRGEDRYCVHLDRQAGGCSVYERRPALCREYDCRKDERIWLDFERRIPAPR